MFALIKYYWFFFFREITHFCESYEKISSHYSYTHVVMQKCALICKCKTTFMRHNYSGRCSDSPKHVRPCESYEKILNQQTYQLLLKIWISSGYLQIGPLSQQREEKKRIILESCIALYSFLLVADSSIEHMFPMVQSKTNLSL